MNSGGDRLARGAKSAQFPAGDNKGKVELKNVSTEPRNEFVPVKIDRTRRVKKIVPKGDMILVKRREAEDISAGGLFIPEEAVSQDRPAEGVIVSTGPKVKPTVLKAGQHIIFGKYSGTEFPFGGETLLFMAESEVIAVVED